MIYALSLASLIVKKGNRDWFVSLKFRIELDRNDLLWTCFDYCEEGN